MFTKVGIFLAVLSGLSALFDWGITSNLLTFGLGMLAIGAVVN